MWKVAAVLIVTATSLQADTRSLELTYLEPVIHESVIDFASLEAAALRNVESVDGYLILRMFPDQEKVNNGNRVEISVDFPFNAGDVVTYQWRLRIPETSSTDQLNRWWNIAQWHDQPDVSIGETWDGFPSRSPSIAIGYISVAGLDYIGLSYGAPDQRSSDPIQLSRGDWHDLRVEIRWSTGSDGYARVFLDDVETPVALGSGANMHNDYQHYFKLGAYRHPDIRIASETHVDNVKIWRHDP